MSDVTKALRIAAVLFAVFGVMLVVAHPAQAEQSHDFFQESTRYVIPFYDISASHAAFLILHAPIVSGAAGVTLNFYDQTCLLKADAFVSLTAGDTAFLNVAKLNPAAPTQGVLSVFGGTGEDFSTSGDGDLIVADLVNIDFTAGTATLLNGIPTIANSDGGGDENDSWTLYTKNAIVVTFGPKEAAPFSTTITLSCPRSNLGADMASAVDGNGNFRPATGTTTTVLDLFVFDTDEKFLGSIHNVTCRCFERQALKTLVPMALTSDVVVYIHGQNGTGTDRSIAGLQETDFVSGTTKLHVSTYLHTIVTAP